MQTAYVVRGHISAEGTIVLDEPAELTPGPVILTIMPVAHGLSGSDAYTDQQHSELWRRIEAIAALPGSPPPDDRLTAKNAEQILYGVPPGASDVR